MGVFALQMEVCAGDVCCTGNEALTADKEGVAADRAGIAADNEAFAAVREVFAPTIGGVAAESDVPPPIMTVLRRQKGTGVGCEGVALKMCVLTQIMGCLHRQYGCCRRRRGCFCRQ
jgi:hypothetical protein